MHIAEERTIWTEHGQAQRPIQKTLRSDGSLVYRTMLKYDKKNRLRRFQEKVSGSSHFTQYGYDTDDHTTKMLFSTNTVDGGIGIGYTYDYAGRVSSVARGSAIRNSNSAIPGQQVIDLHPGILSIWQRNISDIDHWR